MAPIATILGGVWEFLTVPLLLVLLVMIQSEDQVTKNWTQMNKVATNDG
jgi:hypothetical protein